MEIIPASQDLLDATNEFRFTDVASAIEVAESQLGVTNASGHWELARVWLFRAIKEG